MSERIDHSPEQPAMGLFHRVYLAGSCHNGAFKDRARVVDDQE
jgi:hypothetical protein